jgi:hypothetical protein
MHLFTIGIFFWIYLPQAFLLLCILQQTVKETREERPANPTPFICYTIKTDKILSERHTNSNVHADCRTKRSVCGGLKSADISCALDVWIFQKLLTATESLGSLLPPQTSIPIQLKTSVFYKDKHYISTFLYKWSLSITLPNAFLFTPICRDVPSVSTTPIHGLKTCLLPCQFEMKLQCQPVCMCHCL